MKRNYSLDIFKLVLSLLIVTIHTDIYQVGLFGWFISDAIARIGVPCFFIINGFFIKNIINNSSKTKKYIFSLLITFWFWSFVYLFLTLSPKSISSITFFLIFGFWQLWYIPALIGAIILLKLLKRIPSKYLLTLSILLYLLGCGIENFSLISNNLPDRDILIRNFLFIGFPFLYIGFFISNNLQKLHYRLCKRLYYGVGISLITLLIESYLAFYYIGTGFLDRKTFYISLIILCPLIFYLILNLKTRILLKNSPIISKTASAIFYSHLLIVFLTERIFEDMNEWYKLFIILPTSLLFGYTIARINKTVKILV